ncbi:MULTISPECIES: DUF2268 domain-containing putative Zn-dependent protease [unclassified Imperialibacter]|uniref:DUF2268 domain-containing putative Zn-dependent protease n=1 Tax=unclassified Imperialibacter TaxID=2629706 RepID=UPI00125ECE10|nr:MULTISPECIES: DUF2268 domain-containing putative Zn-dependent protease [unclassified Imperialibacter]CAD5291883.1 conserved hypothetical protein [Imperialibacter sp. 89]
MRKLLFNLSINTFVTLLLGALSVGCGVSKKMHASKKPEAAQMVTSDIEHFWSAFDKDNGKNQAMTYESEYLSKASAGLKSFIKLRIGNANNLTKAIYENREQYENIRTGSQALASKEDEIRSYFSKLGSLYPKTIFPDVYFLIGRNNSGGTISAKGLLIGVEMYEDSDMIPEVVVHELIHYQQRYYFKLKSFTLLEQSIKEGSADFVCELVTGTRPYKEIYQYGNAHEGELKAEFQQIMNRKWKEGWNGWMYGGAKDGRPDDLGYWMGYQIVKAYYDKSEEEKKAVKEILTIRNFERFVEKSGYFEEEQLAGNLR